MVMMVPSSVLFAAVTVALTLLVASIGSDASAAVTVQSSKILHDGYTDESRSMFPAIALANDSDAWYVILLARQ
jgi:ADP-ribosylglycohydrolase